MRLQWRTTILLLFLSAVPALAAAAPAQSGDAGPARFRDFKVYTTSAPDPADPGRIVATMRLLNAGARPLDVRLSLGANPSAGFAGKEFSGRIEPNTEAAWTFDLKPPDGLTHEVLKGAVVFGGPDAAPDRELYVAVQGPDPVVPGGTTGERTKVEPITAKAQVVGTHAPRTVDSIRRLVERATPAAPGQPLALVAGGQSKYQIALDLLAPAPGAEAMAFEQWAAAPGRSPPEAELAEAVADLRRCVQLMTGATLPVVAAVPAGAGPAVRIRRIPAPADWPHVDAYRLRTEGEDVVIEATTPDGLRNGVYGLLTDHLDCHWFMPKGMGEELPARPDKSLSLAPLDETRSPSFFSSPGMSWGSAPRWDRQNRVVINRGRMNFGHAWQGLIAPQQFPYDKFPDMWARDRAGKVLEFDKGWSWTNFCSTSPDVIRIVAEKINAQFDASPDAVVASLDPNDLAPLCQCDRCLAVDKQYGVTETDDKQMADRLLHFSKEIHDRLKPEHKGKYLGILAYGFQTRPPKKAVPHPQHAATVCNFPSYFDHSRPFNDPTSSFNRDFHEIVKGWGSRVKQFGFYDYYGHYNFFGPWGIVQKMREDLPAFREAGGTFVVIESQPNFAMNGLNLYVAAQLVRDVDVDVDAVVEQYMTKFFGPAAEPMREFFRTAERHYALTRPGTHTALRVGRRPEFWQELDGHLKRAEELTRGADKRFADRITFTRDGYEYGRRMFHLHSLVPRRGEVPDVAAAIQTVREAKSEIDRVKAKYTPADEYWPTMVATYFYPDLDKTLERLEKLASDPEASKKIGEELDSIGG